MITRECPFCGASGARYYGNRDTAVWAACRACRSIFRDISATDFEDLHKQAEDGTTLIPRAVGASGDQPHTDAWQTLGLAGSTVLEIGPGSGHLLAAARDAGRQVWGVETNPAHRAHIASAWGIRTVHPALSDLPPGRTFDAIVAINVLEHVHDIRGFLRALRTRLAPDGEIFISTSNSSCIVPGVVGPWWSMFKEVDHVAFPSAAGMSAVAAAAGLAVGRVWTGELPLETPIGLAVAVRDYFRCRRSEAGRRDAAPGRPPAAGAPAIRAAHEAADRRTNGRAHRFRPGWEPSARLMARLGRAASIKAVLTHQTPEPGLRG
ncbi:class I SAM-dependent methyltransferase [Protofrankia symbiont of Coriaria ruscifolia]|uniref:class I SAM-dependent methyltransferase n=1 Tax=Protofrankia symbiont of Coriaria ruscifolia TaxID=1306542 RepID=UPI0013EF8AB1|nr:class I SAM-dependent methyltransferase [Protofrankia symbiont of Coriaria ruscifolia]